MAMDCFVGDCARQVIVEPVEVSETAQKWARIMALNHKKLEKFYATRFRRSIFRPSKVTTSYSDTGKSEDGDFNPYAPFYGKHVTSESNRNFARDV